MAYRLGGPDGVSVEAAKWGWALGQLGFSVRAVAGEGQADELVPGLAMHAEEGPRRAELVAALEGADLIVIENVCSLPLNPTAAEALAATARGHRALLHHHDLPWQRPGPLSWDAPPDDPNWAHVTINDLSRRQLASRGILATTVRNCFDTEAPLGDRRSVRKRLGLSLEERVVLHPTRAIARKGVPAAVELARKLDAIYWLAGPAEEGYGPELAKILATAEVPVIHGLDSLSMADAYAACDAVVFPSSWEGFGNAVVESAIHRRPLALRRYPVARELARFGFRWFPADDARPLEAWLTNPDRALLDHNQEVARRHFSLRSLPERLARVFEEAEWTHW